MKKLFTILLLTVIPAIQGMEMASTESQINLNTPIYSESERSLGLYDVENDNNASFSNGENAYNESLSGWHLYNGTNEPVYLAWYLTEPTRFFSFFSPASGIRAGMPVKIEPFQRVFVEKMTQVVPSSTHQLYVTSNEELLTESVPFQSDDLSCFNEKLLDSHLKTDKDTTIVLGYLKTKKEWQLSTGWAFINNAEQEVYCRWHYASWDSKKKAYPDPCPSDDHDMVAIKPNELVYVPFCIPQIRSRCQRQLVFSFNQNDLSLNNEDDAPPMILPLSKFDLQVEGTVWDIFEKDNKPVISRFFETIKLTNTTSKKLYYGLYYVDAEGNAEKAHSKANNVSIKKYEEKSIDFPPEIKGKEIQLFLSEERNKLVDSLKKENIGTVATKSFKQTNTYNWYVNGAEYEILYDLSRPHGLKVSSKSGGALEALFRKCFDTKILDESRKDFKENAKQGLYDVKPYEMPKRDGDDDEKTSLVLDKNLLTCESDYVDARKLLIKEAIHELVGEEIINKVDEIPTIALVFPGGGYRAMVGTLGYLRGADSEEGGNVYNCCSYMMGLSGSTWALNPLVLSGLRPGEFAQQQRSKLGYTLNELRNKLPKNYHYDIQRLVELRHGQFHGLIGYFGHMLANTLLKGYCEVFGKNRHSVTLSDLQQNLTEEDPKYPYPISVAIDPGATDSQRIWYEFSPHYIGTHQDQGTWVPTELFGSLLKEGEIIEQVPEYPLAHYMGIWGSAFAVTVADISKESYSAGMLAKGAYWLSSAFSSLYRGGKYLLGMKLDDSSSSGRAAVGIIPNYNFQNEDISQGLASKQYLELIDGGITKKDVARHNFASIPALSRKVDILIMCDVHEKPDQDTELEHLFASSQEAQRLRLAFPNLTEEYGGKELLERIQRDINEKGYSLIIEEDSPIIIYMKAKKNESYDKKLRKCLSQKDIRQNGFNPEEAGFTKTLNFKYSQEEFELFAGLTESVFKQSKPAIVEAIKEAVQRKK